MPETSVPGIFALDDVRFGAITGISPAVGGVLQQSVSFVIFAGNVADPNGSYLQKAQIYIGLQ